MIRKQIPDKGETVYVYNERNLMIGMQDALLKSKAGSNKYICYEYDPYGRLKRQGIGGATGILDTDGLMIENFYDGKGTGHENEAIYIGKLDKKTVSILEGYLPGEGAVETTYAFDNYGRPELETHYRKDIENGTAYTYIEGSVSYNYNAADKLTLQETLTSLTNVSDIDYIGKVESHDYDIQGRLLSTDTRLYNSGGVIPFDETEEILSNNTFDKLDRVRSMEIGNGLYTYSYDFNPNGWLTEMNSWAAGYALNPLCTTENLPSIDDKFLSQELFSIRLKYNTPTKGGTSYTNGLISELHWKVQGREGQYYVFDYDEAQRLKSATYSTDSDSDSGLYNTSYAYDVRGNITSLTREGLVKNGTCYTATRIDDLEYRYANDGNSNRLIKVIDSALPYCPDYLRVENPVIKEGIYAAKKELDSDANVPSDKNVEYRANELVTLESGFEFGSDGEDGFFLAQSEDCPEGNAGIDSSTGWGFLEGAGDQTYYYDANGNIIEDKNKGFTFEYNILNQPYRALKGGEENKIEWLWTADGRKLRKEVTVGGVLQTSKRYIRGVEIKNDELDAVYHATGRIKYEDGDLRWQYNIIDHLGNVRLVIEDKNEDGIVSNNEEVLQENHYYPFGMQMTGVWLEEEGIEQDYGYNGKEETIDLDLGYLDYGARSYDPTIGRWNAVDPLAEEYLSITPYAYVANTPTNAIDPDGRLIIFINGQTGSNGGTRAYWKDSSGNGRLDERIMNRVGDRHRIYYDGSIGGWESRGENFPAELRMETGRADGYRDAADIINSLEEGETIKVFTHSMGGAYGKGFVQGILDYAKEHDINTDGLFEYVVDMAPFQSYVLEAIEGILNIVIAHDGDLVAGCAYLEGSCHVVTREDASFSLTFEHKVDSFTQDEIDEHVPTSNSNSSKDKYIEKGRMHLRQKKKGLFDKFF